MLLTWLCAAASVEGCFTSIPDHYVGTDSLQQSSIIGRVRAHSACNKHANADIHAGMLGDMGREDAIGVAKRTRAQWLAMQAATVMIQAAAAMACLRVAAVPAAKPAATVAAAAIQPRS